MTYPNTGEKNVTKTIAFEDVIQDVAIADTRVSDTVQAKPDWSIEIADEIVSSIESFLNKQIDQFSEIIANVETAPGATTSGNEEILQLMNQLQTQREQFEQQRAAEIERLQLANQKLEQRWNELENEKRKLLTQPKVSTTHANVTPNQQAVAAANAPTVIQPFANSTQASQGLSNASQIDFIKRQMKIHASRARPR